MEGFNGKYRCIEDYYPGEFLTKGKIYEFKNGAIEYDNNFEGCRYATFEDYCKRNSTLSIRLVPYEETTKSLADVIMAHLGLEEGQKFKIGSGTGTHYFEGDKLMVIVGDEAPRKSLLPLNRFLQETVQPVQWEPKFNERYYYPEVCSKDGVNDYLFDGGSVDTNIKKRVGLYRTYEEARAKAKELGWFE